MHALTPEQYARLGRLAEGWTHRYLRDAKRQPGFNPRLAADALCFQRHRDAVHGDQLVGALVTPVSLWLVMVPAGEPGPLPELGDEAWLSLPSGRYPLETVALGEEAWCRRLVLLDDLSDVTSRQAASRLAQQLMERVMAERPPADGGA
ncbi:[NiFe]-hydrogenase assembly chaperone HybE [Halomonas mongoliensis]|uniref:[NiFe]-hydrogenase assembly chaperone HybE n=1 Tax=Halomonas mongoliensis TaxID=321265 RepID=A0ABU1GKX4_9GAMM|nr:[NiFe]-hydrogenase assembly chaperone HybE [Halomonas mongoliensis]MDR5892628.1 [NiFe]-hydrogenase assembly chaperone HybE [Halomonas mongoliensis]